MFIKINNDHFVCDYELKELHPDDRLGQELIDIDDIKHVYQVKGLDKFVLCIEYYSYALDKIHSAHETFNTELELYKRVEEIRKILNNEF